MRTILLLLLLTSFTPPGRISFTGKVFTNSPQPNTPLSWLYMFVKANGKFIAGASSDNKGHYEIDFMNQGQPCFDFFITGIEMDTLFLGSYTTFKSNDITWDIQLPNTYHKKLWKVVCPKCHKTNKVYPVVYGWGATTETEVNGVTTYNPVVNKNYYANSCISGPYSPHWYCDRDKIKF